MRFWVKYLFCYGLDEKCYGFVMEKAHVVVSPKKGKLSHVKSLEVCFDAENVCI